MNRRGSYFQRRPFRLAFFPMLPFWMAFIQPSIGLCLAHAHVGDGLSAKQHVLPSSCVLEPSMKKPLLPSIQASVHTFSWSLNLQDDQTKQQQWQQWLPPHLCLGLRGLDLLHYSLQPRKSTNEMVTPILVQRDLWRIWSSQTQSRLCGNVQISVVASQIPLQSRGQLCHPSQWSQTWQDPWVLSPGEHEGGCLSWEFQKFWRLNLISFLFL